MKKFWIIVVAAAALSLFGAANALATSGGHETSVAADTANAGTNQSAVSGQSELQEGNSGTNEEDAAGQTDEGQVGQSGENGAAQTGPGEHEDGQSGQSESK